MPALKSAKHEAFSRAIVSGRTGAEAYTAAGYKASEASGRTNAARLLANAGISSRIAELKAAAADSAVMDLREVLAEFSKLGRANMQDFVHIGVADDVVAAISELTPEQAAAIQELTVESYSEPGEVLLEDQAHGGSLKRGSSRVVKRVKFKLHSKTAALAELRAHHAPQKHEHTGKDGTPLIPPAEVSEFDLARRIAFVLAEAERKLKQEGG